MIKVLLGQFLKIIFSYNFSKNLKKNHARFKHFKNDITLILSRERLDTYDNLEQYKENLKLISFVTPKISNLEIYLRNTLDYCLTQMKGSEWVFNESALTPLIKELKEKKKEITHSLILSKMSLGAVIRLIFCYKLEGVILDLKHINFKSYYPNNKNTLSINNKKKIHYLAPQRFILL